MNRVRLVALLVFFCAGSVHALTGAQLYNYCQYEACGGYFVGAFDGLRIAQAVAGDKRGKGLVFCPPEDISDEEVVTVAMRYLERNPRSRYLQAANLSLRAWSEAWPCRESSAH